MPARIDVEGDTIPDVWEWAICKCLLDGDDMPTQYDNKDDPPGKDCMAVLTINEPMKEDRIHKAMPGGYGDLWKYRMEVVRGVHDHWIGTSETAWTYTYHERLQAYGKRQTGRGYGQLERVVNMLVECPYTRRAQATTWIPGLDSEDEHSPCLQRLWFRIVDGKLIMHAYIRSNDALKAAFMNLFAFSELQSYVAAWISQLGGEPVPPGQLVWVADSWHIYGSYIKSGEMDQFTDRLKGGKPIADRTISTGDERVQREFKIAQQELEDEKQQ